LPSEPAGPTPLAWLFVPLSLGLIALPTVMYFLPDRRVEALSTT